MSDTVTRHEFESYQKAMAAQLTLFRDDYIKTRDKIEVLVKMIEDMRHENEKD